MDTQTALQQAETLLQPFAREMTRPAADRLDVTIGPDALLPAIAALLGARWGYLSAITGLDVPAPKAKPGAAAEGAGRLEALYHFSEGAAVATLRVVLPADAASVPSICGPIPAATLYERELAEMFGITVAGTPDTDHLLLPDDWPAGVFPLRKSFSGTLPA